MFKTNQNKNKRGKKLFLSGIFMWLKNVFTLLIRFLLLLIQKANKNTAQGHKLSID